MFKKIIFLILILFTATKAEAALNLSPATQEELIKILQGLATDHAYPDWCTTNCSQIHELKVTGEIAKGELNIEIIGNVMGENNAVVPLFGTMPPVEVESIKNDGDVVALLHHNKSFYTFLSPGPFRLTGTIKVNPQVATNVIMPGAVGHVDLDISDQEPLLKKVALAQLGGSFQIVAAAKGSSAKTTSQNRGGLRLKIFRFFDVARDKTFHYKINVVGAQTGQVITVPLAHGEKALKTEPPTAKVGAEAVAFTATGIENDFEIEGEWTEPEIKITAATGAIEETWSVVCEGAYDCAFSGDVEKAVTASTHEWVPLAGQTLTVTWQELGLLKGQSIVAQQALLDSSRQGEGLKQTLTLSLSSSAADQLFVDLPKDAVPIKLSYGSDEAAVLKNAEGRIHLTIPQGESRVSLTWEIVKLAGSTIPVPKLNLAVGRWVFWFSPNEKQSVILASGPSGSPVVLFWPRLILCLFVAALFMVMQRKYFSEYKHHIVLIFIFCAGFALVDWLSLLAALAYFTGIRLLKRVQTQRTIFGWIFEMGLMILLFLVTVGAFMEVLEKSFFSTIPFRWDDFCSTSNLFGFYRSGNALCWETSHLAVGQSLKPPLAVTVPTLSIRVAYFCWAIVAGYYFYLELKNLWDAVKYYVSKGRRPILKRAVKQG